MKNQKLFWVMTVCVSAVLLGGSAARAALSIDFDSYSLGNLDGQDTWAGGSGWQIIEGANAYSGRSVESTAIGSNDHIWRSAGDSYSSGTAVVDFKYLYLTSTSGCMTLRNGTTRFLTFGALSTNWYAWSSEGSPPQVAGAGGSPRWLDLRMVLDLDNDTADLQWKELASPTYTTAFNDVAITTGATFDYVELDSEKVAMRIDELAIDVPEPVTLALLAAGGLLMIIRKRRG